MYIGPIDRYLSAYTCDCIVGITTTLPNWEWEIVYGDEYLHTDKCIDGFILLMSIKITSLAFFSPPYSCLRNLASIQVGDFVNRQ